MMRNFEVARRGKYDLYLIISFASATRVQILAFYFYITSRKHYILAIQHDLILQIFRTSDYDLHIHIGDS